MTIKQWSSEICGGQHTNEWLGSLHMTTSSLPKHASHTPLHQYSFSPTLFQDPWWLDGGGAHEINLMAKSVRDPIIVFLYFPSISFFFCLAFSLNLHWLEFSDDENWNSRRWRSSMHYCFTYLMLLAVPLWTMGINSNFLVYWLRSNFDSFY